MAALEQKYKELYGKLCRSHRDCLARARMSADFDTLCVILSSMCGVKRFISIASDLGILFEKHGFTLYDFYMFYSEGEQKYGEAALQRLSKESGDLVGICSFFRESEMLAQANKTPPSPILAAEDLFAAAAHGGEDGFLRDRIKFGLKTGEEEKKKLAELILSCPKVSIKTALLPVFYISAFPLPCERLAADAYSENQALRETAIQVLEKCRGSEVRTLALELMKSKTHRASGLCMLITNYRKRDKELTLLALEELPIDYSQSAWHHVVLHILWAFENGFGSKLPRELLYYIYKRSLCSNCRERSVRLMGRRRWLSDEIIRECKYDSNEDIRKYYEKVKNALLPVMLESTVREGVDIC